MAEPSIETPVAELRRRLDGLIIRDAAHFGRRLKNLRGAKPEQLQQLANQIAKAEASVATRQAAVPTITYPAWQIEELRVSFWAQQLGTPRRFSQQPIYGAIDTVWDRF